MKTYKISVYDYNNDRAYDRIVKGDNLQAALLAENLLNNEDLIILESVEI